jgi:Ran GTPase-activating protein (RanGAP) involved in mRNA processing and transport
LENQHTREASPSSLFQALHTNTHVTAIDLSHCNFGDAAVQQICASLPQQIRIVKLRDNDLSDAAAEEIAEIMSRCPLLQSLDLAENEITDAGCKGIAAGVKHARCLEALDLSENDEVTEKGGNAVIKGCSGCPQLRHLNLGEAVVVKGLGDDGRCTSAERLQAGLAA